MSRGFSTVSLCFLLLICSGYAFGKGTNQSILALIAQAKLEKNQGIAVELAERAILESEIINNTELKAQASLEAGRAWKIFGDLVKSEARLLQALDLFISFKDDFHVHVTYRDLGETYRAAKSYEIAARYLQLAKDYFTLQQDYTALASVYNRMAAVYFEESLLPIDQSRVIPKIRDSIQLSFDQLLALVPPLAMADDSLRTLLEASDRYAALNENNEILISNQIIKASFKNRVQEYEQALDELYATLELIEKTGIQEDLPLVYWNLAGVFGIYGLNQLDSSMYYAQKTYDIAVEENISIYRTMAARILLENYIAQGNSGKASFFLNELINAITNRTANQIEISSSLANAQLALRESELELAAKQKQNLFILISFLLAIIFFAGFVFLMRRKNQRQKMLMDEIQVTNALIQEKNRELADLNQEKDKFFSIIAHDLRNPFANVMGLASLIDEEIKRKEFANLADYSQLISESSKQALELLTNLMTWARSQTGKLTYQPKAVLLEDLLDQELDAIQLTARQKGIKLKVQVEEGLALTADPYMLRAILRNLLANALKFTHSNGRVALQALHTKAGVELIVSDNGIGMPADMADNLFKMKVDYRRMGTNGEASTGLGLLICEEFVAMHKGSITVKSEEGRGTEFTVLIPHSEKYYPKQNPEDIPG